MVYVSQGGTLQGQQGWSLSSIPDMFWGAINFIVLFFQTLVNPDLTKKGSGYTNNYSNPGRGPPPGPPRRRLGGLGRQGGASPPPMSGGG